MRKINIIDSLKQSLEVARAEHQNLDAAIRRVEGMLATLGTKTPEAAPKRRGRPLGSKNRSAATKPARKLGGRKWTAAQRQAAAERMRANWAAKKSDA